MREVERRVYTEAEKAAVVEGYRRWEGGQGAYAKSVGIPQTTLSRWVNGRRRTARRRAAAEPPTMLEVMRPATATLGEVETRPSPSGVRLALGGGVALDLEALPPARWVAELAAELRRC